MWVIKLNHVEGQFEQVAVWRIHDVCWVVHLVNIVYVVLLQSDNGVSLNTIACNRWYVVAILLSVLYFPTNYMIKSKLCIIIILQPSLIFQVGMLCNEYPAESWSSLPHVTSQRFWLFSPLMIGWLYMMMKEEFITSTKWIILRWCGYNCKLCTLTHIKPPLMVK